MSRPATSRVLVVVALLAVLVVVAAPPAAAHGGGSEATNYDSRVTDTPDVAGVAWTVYAGDDQLGVTNTGAHEVIVLGYEDEPYLRLDADGVWQNRRSPAAYLNDDRYAQVQVPAHADEDADPDWHRTGGGPTALWHDHRIHWMSPDRPPAVTDKGREAMVFDWEVPVLVDGDPATVAGELWWIPSPAPWPYLAGGLALALPALAGLVTSRPRGQRWPALARPAAAVVAVAALANLTRLVDHLTAVPVPFGEVAGVVITTAVVVAVGLAVALRGWRGRPGDLVALALGAVVLALTQGLAELGVLGASQLTTVFPDWVPRLVVALTLLQGPLVVAATALGYRRLSPSPASQPELTEQPAGGSPG